MPELDLAPAPGTGLIRNATTGLVSDLDASYTSVLYLVGNEVQVLASDPQALIVGRVVGTPALAVATNVANSVTGILITANAAGGNVTVAVTSSAGQANEGMQINAKGTGTFGFNTAPITQAGLIVSGGSLAVVSPDADFTTGGNRAILDVSVSEHAGRVGGVTGGGTAITSLRFVVNTAEAWQVRATGLGPLTAGAAFILDQNGNSAIGITATASAVDYISVINAATANPATVQISAAGTDTNVHLQLVALGTGAVLFPNGAAANPGLVAAGSTTTGFWRAAANQIGVAINGADTFRFVNNGFHMISGAMFVRDAANGNVLLAYSSAASAVDYLQVGNVATGSPAVIPITAAGSDSNIGVNFALAGTGTFAVNSIVSQVQNARLTADTSPVNNSAVLVNVGLGLTIGANEIWLVTYFLAVSQASALAGLRFGLTGPAGLAFIGWGTTFSAAAVTGGASAAANPFFNATNAGTETSAVLTVRVTATAAGTVNLQFAQSVATVANTIIQNGSYYRATRVA